MRNVTPPGKRHAIERMTTVGVGGGFVVFRDMVFGVVVIVFVIVVVVVVAAAAVAAAAAGRGRKWTPRAENNTDCGLDWKSRSEGSATSQQQQHCPSSPPTPPPPSCCSSSTSASSTCCCCWRGDVGRPMEK